MKLSPDVAAWQTLQNTRRLPGSGAVHAGRSEAAETRASPASFRDLALSLGLPRDALSASLLSLAKFFSLPMDTKLLLQLRQQALASAAPPQEGAWEGGPETPPHNGSREGGPETPPLAGRLRSAALAAAAAAGKGVVLSPEALGSYAAALSVDDREGAAPGDEPEGGRDQATKEGDGPGFSPPRKGEAVFFAEGIEERLPLLGVLNRIPGRDGRRWIALPFSFRSGGVDCKVSLRILLADTNGIPWRAERLALDVGTNRRRWSFMLENAPAGEGRLFARAVFGARPPLSARAERGLRELLGGIAEKLILRDSSGGAFPGEEGGEDQWNR